MADKSFIGKGRIYMGPYAQNGANRFLGNCSRLELAIGQEKKDLLDFTQAGGGKANSLTRITEVTAAITLHDLDGANLAMALYGSSTSNTTVTAIVDESQPNVYKGTTGGFVKTARLINTAQSVTVKVAPSTVKTAGTDYIVRGTGIEIPSGSTIADLDDLLISYTPIADDAVEALVNSGVEFKLFFDGLNEAQSGKPVSVTLHRIKFTPTSGMGLIGDDFAGLELSAEVLSDSLQATGSKYFDIQIAQ